MAVFDSRTAIKQMVIYAYNPFIYMAFKKDKIIRLKTNFGTQKVYIFKNLIKKQT